MPMPRGPGTSYQGPAHQQNYPKEGRPIKGPEKVVRPSSAILVPREYLESALSARPLALLEVFGFTNYDDDDFVIDLREHGLRTRRRCPEGLVVELHESLPYWVRLRLFLARQRALRKLGPISDHTLAHLS